MSPELKAAIERLRGHKMTSEERFEQRVSFVYGQQDWDSPNQQTKDQIREHLIEIYGRPPDYAKVTIGAWNDPQATMTDEELIRANERERIATWLEKRGIAQTETESDNGWWDTSTGADFGKLTLSLLRAGKYAQDEVGLEKQIVQGALDEIIHASMPLDFERKETL